MTLSRPDSDSRGSKPPPPPLAAGTWEGRVGADLTYLGGDRLLDRDPAAGTYRIWHCRHAFTRPGRLGVSNFGCAHDGGVWEESRHRHVLWVGGDTLLVVDLQSGDFTFWEYDRDERTNLPFRTARGRSGNHRFIGKRPCYAGRGHIIDRSMSRGGYRILGAWPSPRWRLNPTTGPVTSALLPGYRLAWLGGDRLLLYRADSRAGKMYRYGPSGISPVFILNPGPVRNPAWPDTIDLKQKEVVYLGGDDMLLLEPTSGEYEIFAVPFHSKINSGIEDFLELHLDVRESIGMQVDGGETRPYRAMDVPAGFYWSLSRYFDAIRAGNPVELTWEKTINPATGELWTGPRSDWYQQAPELIIDKDVIEIYAAHVAQCLAMEIGGKLGWSLRDYDREQLELLLHCDHLFAYVDTTPDGTAHYHTLHLAKYVPGNPAFYYRFMTGDTPDNQEDLVAGTARETVLNLCHWMTMHLRHGPNVAMGDDAAARYGYRGYAPIELMITRRTDPVPPQNALGPGFWSWAGSHSAVGLLAELLRSVNIPAEGLRAYFPVLDWGFEVPSERMFLVHVDHSYATTEHGDPDLDPSTLFFPDAEYDAAREKWSTPAQPGEEDQRFADYRRIAIDTALPVPTWYYVYLFLSGSLVGTLTAGGAYDPAEAQAAVEQHAPALQAKYEAWAATQAQPSTAAYFQFWSDWMDTR